MPVAIERYSIDKDSINIVLNITVEEDIQMANELLRDLIELHGGYTKFDFYKHWCFERNIPKSRIFFEYRYKDDSLEMACTVHGRLSKTVIK